jgi:hypothetical protein
MKGYKLPFTDKFGNALHEGDEFKYTAHRDLSIPNFEGKIVWIKDSAAFGYERLTPIFGTKVTAPFSKFNDLKNDFLRHIERIEK